MISGEMRHALRTPLNHILGYVDLVTEDARDQSADSLLPDLFRIKTAALDLLSQIEVGDGNAPLDPFEFPQEDDGLEFLKAFTPPEDILEGRILVVDDDAGNREVLVRTLEKRGYSVRQAANGVEAFELLREPEDQTELILLDIVMPEMNGWEMLQRLKVDEALKNLPVIMISGIGETDAVVRCLELGAEDFVQKPFVPTILKARVRTSIAHKRTRDSEVDLLTKLRESYRELREFAASETIG